MTLTLENPENDVISRVIFLSRIQFLRCYFMLVILLRAKRYQGKYPTGTGNIREISGKMILKNESPPCRCKAKNSISIAHLVRATFYVEGGLA